MKFLSINLFLFDAKTAFTYLSPQSVGFVLILFWYDLKLFQQIFLQWRVMFHYPLTKLQDASSSHCANDMLTGDKNYSQLSKSITTSQKNGAKATKTQKDCALFLITAFVVGACRVCACAKLFQLCLTLCNPMDCSLPGSSVHGILQYWSGLPCPPPGHLSDPEIEPTCLLSLALAGGFFTTSATWEAHHAISAPKQLNNCHNNGDLRAV